MKELEEISMNSSRISEEEQGHQYYYSDPLNCLPDELLLLIFSKITDPKTLLLCSLISKRITTVICRSKSLSIHFLTRLFPFTTIPIAYCFDDICDQLTKLLCRFHGVQCLCIELPCYCRCPNDLVFKWKVKADVRYGILTFLSAKLVSKINYKTIQVENDEVEGQEHKLHSYNSFGPFVFANKVYAAMILLISRHPNLDRIEFVDSKKHGAISLRREELIKLRMAENSDLIGSGAQQSVWNLPKVRLPLSGFEMEDVTLVVTRGDRVDNRNWKHVDGNVEAALDGRFEYDEYGIFDEAMTQVLTRNHLRTLSF